MLTQPILHALMRTVFIVQILLLAKLAGQGMELSAGTAENVLMRSVLNVMAINLF